MKGRSWEPLLSELRRLAASGLYVADIAKITGRSYGSTLGALKYYKIPYIVNDYRYHPPHGKIYTKSVGKRKIRFSEEEALRLLNKPRTVRKPYRAISL